MTKNVQTVSVTVGPSFCTLLTILFIALKLTDYIDWSWWWVLSPIWIPAALVFGIWGLGLLCILGWYFVVNR